MKRFLSLTLIAIMLFSTLTLTSCVLPKELRGGFIDILYNVAASILGEYEINEAQWEKAMAQTNYTVQWNVSPNRPEDFPGLEYSYVDQMDGLRYEHSRNEYKIGNQISILYTKNGDVYYKYTNVVGKSFEYKGGLAYENYYYCLGYLTQSPIKTLAQETFLEGVKFEDLEYDGVGGYSYKTTLFGEEIEYIFEFKFGNLYRMQCGFFIAYDIGVTDVYDYSSYANPVDKKLD